MTFFHSSRANIAVKITPDTRLIVNRLSKLTGKFQKKSIKKAARIAMGPVKKEAIANAKAFDNPLTPERVWKNITIQEATKSSKRLGGVVMRVGVKGGAKKYASTKANVRAGRAGKKYNTLGDNGNPGGDTWYWRFVEFGTSRTPAKKFLRSALKNNIQGVTDRSIAELSRELDKLAAEK
jgi:HK97 gp10 family phage protein